MTRKTRIREHVDDRIMERGKMPTPDLKHPELSYKIVGCAMRVHSALGPGFPESVYHRALVQALAKEGLPFESEKSIEVFYEQALCGLFRMDLVV